MHERLAALRWIGVIACALVLLVSATPADEAGLGALRVGQGAGDEQVIQAPKAFPRNVAWWPYTSGPHYGLAKGTSKRQSNVLMTPVGSFQIGEQLALPPQLTNGLEAILTGRQQYFLVQLKDSALAQDDWEQTLLSQGASIVAHVPVNGLILRLDQSSYGLIKASPLLQHIEPYHAAFRLAPTIGTMPRYDAQSAASPVFDLELSLFPGEPVAPTAALIESAGGSIISAADGPSPSIRAQIHASQIPALAKIESVRIVNEATRRFHMSDGALFLQSEEAAVGDYVYWKAGVDGDGQIVHVTDSGLGVDAYDFSDNAGSSGWNASLPCRVAGDHRKVRCYRTAGEDGIGGAGDLNGCDSITSGQFSHGGLVSGIAVGNGTRDEVPAGPNPSPSPDFGGPGWYTDSDGNDVFSELQDTAFDGVAKGAKVVFIDAQAGCPDSTSGLQSGNLANNINNTWNNYKANIHNFSFGSEPNPLFGPSYGAGATQIDDAIFNSPINFLAQSAGNYGDANKGGASTEPGNVSNEATCKNCMVVGASDGVNGALTAYSSEGPPTSSSSLRVLPTIVAQGSDFACRSENGLAGEVQDAPPTCQSQGAAGTSFSAPNIAGAAAMIGSYLNQGFYPDGTDQNATNDNDKVTAHSSALTKAIMIVGTRVLAFGQRANVDGRFNNLWGYGQLFLPRALPLVEFPEQTVSGLILHDLPGNIDGVAGDDGVSNLSLPATIGTGGGTRHDAEFLVLGNDEDLGIALAWHDPTGVNLVNDLDLEVTWCGADEDCTTAGDNRVYYGNAFSELPDRNPANYRDIDGDGTAEGWAYSISADNASAFTYSDWRDTANVTEAVFVPSVLNAVDWNADGTDDILPISTGKWQVSVIRRSGTTGNLPFSVAISGPVSVGSSVRLSANPVVCNGEENVIVTEVVDTSAPDPSCTESSCPPSVIASRTVVTVKDAGGTVVDTETNPAFRQIGTETRFELDTPLLLSSNMDAVNDDGLLTVQDGYSIEVVYTDQVTGEGPVERLSAAQVDCSPQLDVGLVRQIGPDGPFALSGGCDADRYLDSGETFGLFVSFFNLDPIDLQDAVLTIKACENPDKTRQPGDPCTPNGSITLHDAEQALNFLPGQQVQAASFNFTVSSPPAGREWIDFDLCLSAPKVGQSTESCHTFTLLGQADDETHYYITDCPNGCENVLYDINFDETYESAISRNPFDPLDIVRRGLSEIRTYEPLTAAADENSNGTADCEEGGNNFTCGNPGFNGPWNFDSDDEGFRVGVSALSVLPNNEMTNWGEDQNWDGIMQNHEDQGGTAFVLDNNWGTGGGCGWMSNDVGSGPGGIWHTGTIRNWESAHSTSVCRPNDNVCEEYDVFLGTDADDHWFEGLRTPVLHPVHFGADPRDGYDWRTQILDFSWAMQWDTPFGAAWSWEFDLDTNDQETQLGDYLVGGIEDRTGLLAGGQLNNYDGALMFAPTDNDPSSPTYGDEWNGSKGGNRAARRGCYFNGLDQIDGQAGKIADDPTNVPKPVDDDCDNEFDLGTDGCPGTCGVDDDGNGVIDDIGEICPCRKCSGGPRDGVSCTLHSFCNPGGADLGSHCIAATDAAGRPTAYGDDVCGDGNTDEGIFATFGTDVVQSDGRHHRQTRNGTPELVNGIASGGRPNGDFRYNTLEDFFDPVGDSWQAEIGFYTFEGNSTTQPQPSYGVGLDSMVIEWMELHPIDQAGEACSAASPGFEGRCAELTIAETNSTYDGDQALAVSVTDPVPDGNLIDCDGDGTMEVQIEAYSEAERSGETYCLDPTSPGGNHFEGVILTSTQIRQAGDGLVYLAYNYVDTPSVTALYFDQDDGVHDVNVGPDGQPGVAGFDDDGDGTIDNIEELCPTTSKLAAGRSPHLRGQAARYSDDSCGCLDNPIGDATVARFDVADVIISTVETTDDGDGDGYADPGEEVTITVTVRNLSDFRIEDIELRLTTNSDKVDCLTDDVIRIAALEPRGLNGEGDWTAKDDTFSFIAKDVTRPVGDTSSAFASEFIVTMRALGKATADAIGEGRRSPVIRDVGKFDIPLFGTAVRQSFNVVHNLDLSGSPGTATDWTEDFESYSSDADLFNSWVPMNTGDRDSELDDNRCQYNDPSNPQGNNIDPFNFCEIGEGYSNSDNDWHLAASGGCLSQKASTCEPRHIKSIKRGDGVHNDGAASLHMGTFRDANAGGEDGMSIYENRMRWVETQNNIQLGMDPAELSYWTQISLTDYRLFSVPFGGAVQAAATYVCVDENNNNECDTNEAGNEDNSEHWEKLTAFFNTEQGYRPSNSINCQYDPADDGSVETEFFENSSILGPSSTCFPQMVDSCLGRTREPNNNLVVLYGTQVTLASICFPETGAVNLPAAGIYETGQGIGGGLWAFRKYDLQKFRGRKILLRFHVSPMGIPGFDTCTRDKQNCTNRDDGWFIDDIVITNTSNSDFDVVVDNSPDPTPQVCDGVICTAVDARLSVLPYPRTSRDGLSLPALACSDAQLAHCDYDDDGVVDASDNSASARAPGRALLLDASKSAADACIEGALEYKFTDQTGAVVRDWLSDPEALVSPTLETEYSVEVRCSSATSCNGTASIIASDLPPRSCMTTDLAFSSKTVFDWNGASSSSCVALFDVTRGDLAALSSGSWAGQTCLEDNGSDLTATDPATPSTNGGFWYLARHDGDTWSSGGASEQGDRDSTVTGCP